MSVIWPQGGGQCGASVDCFGGILYFLRVMVLKLPGSLLFFLFALLAADVASCAESNSFVLLHNGNVLSGSVRLVDQQYRIANDGSEVRLRPEKVALVAESLNALYDQLRRRTPTPSLVDHLRLADWCIRNELWPQAARELFDGRQMAPRHPQIAVLDRRLGEAYAAAEARKQLSASKVDSSVVQAAYEAEEALEPLPMELPEGTLEHFTRRIQPILVNNCTVAGCHMSGGSETFQLNRDLLHGQANQRSTRGNLIAVLEAINRGDPQQSPLLKAIREPHAGMPRPLFFGRKAPLQRVVTSWVDDVTRPAETADQPAVNRDEPGARIETITPTYGNPLRMTDDVMGDDEYAPLPAAELKVGARLKRWAPRDEFDPELFNRQHRTRSDDEPEPAAAAAPNIGIRGQ